MVGVELLVLGIVDFVGINVERGEKDAALWAFVVAGVGVVGAVEKMSGGNEYHVLGRGCVFGSFEGGAMLA